MDLKGKRVYVENLGCAKNQVDAELMLHELAQHGSLAVADAAEADLILVNTCAFIESARVESIDTFFELHTAHPDTPIVITGCLSQRYADALAQDLPEAAGILGNRDPRAIASFLSRLDPSARAVELPPYPALAKLDETRGVLLNFPGSAYLKLSEGCNHCCRYCAIPLIRGPLQSRPRQLIVTEAQRLIESGVKEINLIAQDLASYGQDWDGKTGHFNSLLQDLATLEGEFYLRLLYIHPDAFPVELPEIIAASEKIIPYFDLPFQHASKAVLQAMGRRGDAESYLRLIESIRQILPDATFRSTFMLGFTHDDKEAFSELKAFIQAAQLDWAGTFIYSPEEGTSAYGDSNPRQLARSLRQAKRNQKEFLALQEPITQQRLARFVNRELEILIEEILPEEELAIGRSLYQAPEVDGLTVVSGAHLTVGEFVPCKIVKTTGYDLQGVVIQ